MAGYGDGKAFMTLLGYRERLAVELVTGCRFRLAGVGCRSNMVE